MEIKFENLPSAMGQLIETVANIERLMLQKYSENVPNADRWLSIKELCEYLPDKPTVKTAYRWVSMGLIPYYKPSKKLAFLKSQIDLWIMTERGKIVIASAHEDDNYLKPKRKKKIKLSK